MKSLAFLIAALVGAAALADVVTLTDGTKLQGEIKRAGDGWTVTDADGKVTIVAAGQLRSIEKTATGGTESADQRLASLRRSVGNLTDIHQILDRYNSFIAQNKGTPAAAQAQQEVGQWQDRLDKGLTKVGDQWVTKEQYAELAAKALEASDRVRVLIVAGKLADASTALDKALAVMPASATLSYMKGIVLFRQLQLVPSRNAFQAVEAQLPDHAPAHNNVAVILWKTHAQMPALLEYDKAMMADPDNQTILDNVAEALHALAADHRKNDLTKRVVEHFNEQDAALQRTMAQKGRYRWGSKWLDEKEFNNVQAAEKSVKDKIDSLQKDFDETQARLIAIARNIDDDRNLMNTMSQQSMQLDPNSGRIIRFPLPQRYYDLDRDISSLQAESVMRKRQLQDIQRLAADQQKKLPQPPYSGTQKLIDVEGTPGGPATTTQPATQTSGGQF